jgi:predicted Zn-ribbon and HTH transcriptional regulator
VLRRGPFFLKGLTMEPELSHEQQLQAAQHLPADLMLVKMEGEHIMTMAATRRRPIAEVIKEACGLLEANPIAAQQAVYSKPVGLKPDRCKKCGNQVQRKGYQKFNSHCSKCGGKGNNQLMVAGKMQFARGLSIRAAESLRSVVGFNRLGSAVTREQEGLYKISVIFTDYANGIITSDEDFVSQYAKDRNGGVYKQDDVRFMELTLKAAKSKTKRNVVRDSLPYELRQAYEAKAMEVAPRFLTPEKVQEIIDSFGEQGVMLADLQVLVGKAKTEGWTKAEYETLRGVWTALDNGEMTVHELLAECRSPAESPEQSDGNGQSDSGSGKADQPKSGGTSAAVAAELTGSGGPIPETPPENAKSDSPPQTKSQPRKAVSAPSTASTGQQAAINPVADKVPAQTTKSQPGKEKSAPVAAGPVGTPPASSPASTVQTRKSPSMTPEGLKTYMRMRWEEEVGEFDLDRLANAASQQPNPMGYIDLIIGRQNSEFQNFIASQAADQAGDQTELPVDDGPAAEDVNQDPAGDEPECITDPLTRPDSMDPLALEFERKIIGKRSYEQIRQFAHSDIKSHPDLTTEECAYLLDLAERRAWQLEHNVTTTDRAPRE